MFSTFLVILAVQAAAAQSATVDATQLAFSAPRVVAEIDSGKLKGNPVRLAWGEDGGFFLRVAQTDIYQNELGRNYLLPAAGGAAAPVDDEPAWASMYWSWKSGMTAPGLPGLRLEIEVREQNKTATGSTGQDFGGAGGGTANPNRSDPTSNQIAKDLGSMQKVVTTTVKLKGQLIVEAQNARVVPGLTFGWAPAPLSALAYSDARKRLAIVDRNGKKHEVAGTAEVLLPAWSPDGRKIAFLQKTDRKKYTLSVVEISQ
jgi:hypothetical protein